LTISEISVMQHYQGIDICESLELRDDLRTAFILRMIRAELRDEKLTLFGFVFNALAEVHITWRGVLLGVAGHTTFCHDDVSYLPAPITDHVLVSGSRCEAQRELIWCAELYVCDLDIRTFFIGTRR
jgi:hypothetical protein